MQEWFTQLYFLFFGSNSLLAPEYLLVAVFVAWGVYLVRRPGVGFRKWLLPGEIYGHKSSWLDIKLMVIGRVIDLVNILGRVSITTVVALWVADWVGRDGPLFGVMLAPLTLAFVFFLIQDALLYGLHRAFHQISLIWPLHAVHHSAEVLTPITAYRQHPGAVVLSIAVISTAFGFFQGLILGAMPVETAAAQIAGTNAFLVLANFAVANLHHSHIWLSFGPVLERCFISPAQHQVHHSVNPAHFNKNYGQTLAIWDWMFGTLYVVGKDEEITFGLDGPLDAPLMTHDLTASVMNPLQRMWRTLRRTP